MEPSISEQLPLLSFEFATSTGQKQPLTFINPVYIFEAYTVDEVIPCLNSVQAEVEKGYYAAGFLSYESAPAFQQGMKVKAGHKMPLLWFGIYDEPIKDTVKSHGSYTLSHWKSTVSKEEYHYSIQAIKNAIEQGETYQTNFTIRLEADFAGDDLAFYEKLKHGQASNYSAYLNIGKYKILSASPELFFHLNGNMITTRPMKGTIQRGYTLEQDELNSNTLFHSKKNRAENVMIVDLLRNDLGMVAETGSVNVSKLFEIEKYPTLHQMTSTICATVAENRGLIDIFKAIFPCGSITGAPKLTTMAIISELETSPREVYCGAIGYLTPEKEAIFNVPIRTVIIDEENSKAVYGVGGGITWDSTTTGEYEEILTKARFLKEHPPQFDLLESLLLEDGEYFLLDQHLRRLGDSATYFSYTFINNDVKQGLISCARKHPIGKFKVRLLLSKSGGFKIETEKIKPISTPIKIVLAMQPIERSQHFLYHKTTYRDIYTNFQRLKPQHAFDVLLWNEADELTEFTNGNIVVELGGKLWTPPVESGLLGGTFRNTLVQSGKIHEKVIYKNELINATTIWFINSVRKWLEVELL
ncbi:aminodeoxychorismate synthase component I [Bacillus sp. DNRA2]|uniref:aminodeoxychorismate synthase component I n=1 Tax=Bacillus sp. DNRA2 TaxID=2723053 RepID=UPI00145DE39E|nr:aminodeoxychorismate synthase component I [Bacillus sp. DNRA2]NMD70385.1 aminodeoxychorismate synthase component I [Bacillus sp. DNRA2]